MLESAPSVDPGAGIGGEFPTPRAPKKPRKPPILARLRKLRGSGAEPQQSGAFGKIRVCSSPPETAFVLWFVLAVSSTSHLSALTSSMSISAPGFAITRTASKG